MIVFIDFRSSEKGIATIITDTCRGGSSFLKRGGQTPIKTGMLGVPSKNCEWEGGCGDFFKELTLIVSILNAQNYS